MKKSALICLIAAVLSANFALADNTTAVGRAQLAHPNLGHTPGAVLHSHINDLWTKLGDDISTRYKEYTAQGNSTTVTYTHNLGEPFADIVVVLYSGTGTSKTRISDPTGAGWTIAAGASPTTQVSVTTPASGGPHDFSLEIYGSLKGMAVQDPSAVSITGGTLKTINFDDYVDFNEEASPSTPAAGKVRVYGKADGRLYLKDDTGLEQAVGSGAGAGEITVVDNPSDSTGWAASGAGVTVATTTTASDLPLAGVTETAIKITPVSGTDYVRYRWTQPAALKNRKLKVEWHQRPLSGYATGDLKVDVYKHSDSGTCTYSGGSFTRFSLATDSSSVSSIPNQTGKYTTSFDADNADCYELRIGRVAGTTALNLASVIVGPGIQPQGAVVQGWQSYTPTVSGMGSGTAASTAQWRRVGTTMQIKQYTTVSVNGTGASVVTWSLPTGYTVDTANLPNNAFTNNVRNALGHALVFDSSTGGVALQEVITNDATTVQLLKTGSTSTYTGADLATTKTVSFDISVPIAEWSGSGTTNVSQNDVEFAFNTSTADSSDTSSFGYGPNGVAIGSFTAARNKRVRFQTPFQSGDLLIIEVKDSTIAGAQWVPIAQEALGYIRQNTTSYGIYGVFVNSTDYDVKFNTYATANGATYGAAGSAWSGFTNYYWRVRKVANGQAVGFGLADTNSAGLVSTQAQTFSGAKTMTADLAVGTATGSASVESSAGTAAAPTYSFVNDTNTGIFRLSGDYVAVSTGGLTAGYFANDQALHLGNGSQVVSSGFFVTTTTGSNSCKTACSSNEPSTMDPQSGLCIGAWRTDNGDAFNQDLDVNCGDTTSVNKKCMCIGGTL